MGKKEKQGKKLMEKKEKKLIKSVQRFPVLYANTMQLGTYRESMWKNVARDMEETVKWCKQKWAYLRCSYGRYLRKERTGSASTHHHYHQELQFLKEHLEINLQKKKKKETQPELEPESSGDEVWLSQKKKYKNLTKEQKHSFKNITTKALADLGGSANKPVCVVKPIRRTR
uniref:uncharacterized protein LOC108949971 n=1 Tax=Ciona intestinalis TaxID=7719 RepID=UPI00089DAD7A|nr:uncharacterized protein LOC108949971 [Ciona intestinalis]|eukprot:XP_018669798.1 uncharacterized protein LOC108949971 [Ciona intestinalis]